MRVRTLNPNGFRTGQWATIIGNARRDDRRPLLIVKFEDDVVDLWVADDEDGQYEFEGEELNG